MNKSNNFDVNSQISEPSEEEISDAQEKIKKKYDVILSLDDAIKVAKLYKEFEWWFMIDKFSRSPKSITIDMAKEIREYFKTEKGKDLTLDEAHQLSKDSLAQAIPIEKEKIASAIKDIVSNY